MAVHGLLYQYKAVLVGSIKYTVHHFSSGFRGKIYYCMTGRAIRVNIMFEIYRGRKWNISLYCSTRGFAIIDLIYDFCVTIGTGNTETIALYLTNKQHDMSHVINHNNLTDN